MKLLNNLNTLINTLSTFNNTEFGKKILEIDKTPNSKHYQKLKRLSNSLERYVNKDKNNTLVYVGFMGSFSSGKSSTINSILDLWDTEYERKTGHQTTDKAITLLTHPSNEHNIENIITENQAVPIRHKLIKNDILKNIVIVDTPGSGDPDIMNEVIRDFLPICDYVFYCFQVNGAFSESDIPFVKKKQNELKFIPMKFVLTRASEYIKDDTKSLNENNFKKEEFEEELNQLIGRIKEQIPEIDTDRNLFNLIDNKKKFRIDKLKKNIQNLTSLENIHSDELTLNKLSYFKDAINYEKRFFVNVINNKIDVFNNFYISLNTKVIEYENIIKTSSSNLTAGWKTHKEILDKFHNETKNKDLKESIDFKESIKEEEQYIKWNNKLNTEISSFASTISSHNSNKFKNSIEILLDNEKKIIDSFLSIEKNNLLDELYLKNLKEKFTLEYEFNTNISLINKDEIDKSFYNIKSITQNILQQKNEKININYNSLNGHINQDVMKTYKNSISEIFKILKSNINHFFQSADSYHRTVMFAEDNNILRNFHILLDTSIMNRSKDSDYKEKIFSKINNKLFKISDEQSNNFNKNKLTMINDVKEHSKSHKSFKVFDNLNSLYEDLTLNIQNIKCKTIESKVTQINAKLKEKERSFIEKCSEIHKIEYSKYQDELNVVNTNRKNKIIKISFLIAFIGGFIAFGGLKYLNHPVPNTFGVSLLMGIISGVVTYLITSKKDNKKGHIGKKVLKEKYCNLIYEQYLVIKSTTFQYSNNYQFDDFTLQNNIKLEFTNKLNILLKEEFFSEMYKNYSSLEKEYSYQVQSIKTYNKLLEEFYTSIIPFIEISSKNEDELKDIGSEIKEYIMEPSYKLLKERFDNIKDMKLRIHNLNTDIA